jgi:hypothetical protein
MFLLESDDQVVFGFLRSGEEETLLVLVNLSDEEVSDYRLSLDGGPLRGEETATVLLGDGDVVAPTVNAGGGFEGCQPVASLSARASLILLLEP